MSILSLGRHTPAPTTDAGRHWWDWNPAGRDPSAVPEASVREPWYRWNPYLRTPQQVESQGRREWYASGVRDEQRVELRRQRRRSHPILALVVFFAAASGVGFLGLAYEEGSFAAGGAVVDHTLSDWRADLTGVAGRAGDRSGQAVQSVGQSISRQSRRLQTGG
jgi:hypothetical protein